MLDEYWIGENNRQSPEADVPIIDRSSVEYRLGGAANVSSNLVTLGLNPILISTIGDDKNGALLSSMCLEKFRLQELIEIKDHMTTTKTRIVDQDFNQWLRVDHEKIGLPHYATTKMISVIEDTISENDIAAIIIQDYNKGVIIDTLIEKVQTLSVEKGIPLFVDPKVDNFKKLSICTVFKPNLKELEMALGRAIEPIESSITQAIAALGLEAVYIFVTLAEHGVYHLDTKKGHSGIVSGQKIESPDVSGAGDTVLATLVWSYLNGENASIMAQKANDSGYQVCLKKGVSTVEIGTIS